MTAQQTITESQWDFYDEHGYLRLGKLVTDAQLDAMRQRIDDIMLGRAKFNYDHALMQLDSDNGAYQNIGPMTNGHKGAQLNYRKIEQLEFDPLYLSYMQSPIFRAACAHIYGADTPITIMRAMFMNKPAGQGTWLPWHQDAWTMFELHPLLTVWMALDPSTKENGCVQVIPGSHKRGRVNPTHNSGFLTEEQARRHCPPQDVLHVEMEPGEVALFHNFTLHASDVNHSDGPRRAFSVCYMDAASVTRNETQFSRIFGPGALTVEQVESQAG